MRVSWDEAKALKNSRKHGVSFHEAAALLRSGKNCLEIFDEAHSADEDRFITIGPISSGLLVVVWTEEDEEVVRIISARQATRRERALYQKFMERLI